MKRILIVFGLLVLIVVVYFALHSLYILPFWVTVLKACAIVSVVFWGLGWFGRRKA